MRREAIDPVKAGPHTLVECQGSEVGSCGWLGRGNTFIEKRGRGDVIGGLGM